MGLGLISAGFIFFFLPDFTILDLLPDLIGYLLISAGLVRLGDMYEDVAQSKKMFSRLVLLGIAKLLSVFVIFGVSDGADRPTTILVVMFILSFAELLLCIPAYINLFDGITYIGTREDGVAVFRSPKEKRNHKRSYTDRIKRSTLTFFVFKNVLSVMPEMLSISGTDSVQSYNHSRYDFVNHFRVISMIIILIMGIVWFVKITRYFSALKKDVPFMERIKEKYKNEICCNESIFIRRRIKTAFWAFSIGAILALDIYVDGNAGFNLIPDFVTAVCFACGAYIVGEKKCIYKLMSIISAVTYGILSIVSYYVNYNFNLDFHPRDVSTKVLAYNRWGILLTVSAAEAICFFIMIAFASMLLYQVVKKHCGYIPIHSTIDPVARSKAIYSRLKKYICIALALGTVAGGGIFFRVASFKIDAVSEWSWIIELIFEAIFAVAFILCLIRINEEVEEKYQFS